MIQSTRLDEAKGRGKKIKVSVRQSKSTFTVAQSAIVFPYQNKMLPDPNNFKVLLLCMFWY